VPGDKHQFYLPFTFIFCMRNGSSDSSSQTLPFSVSPYLLSIDQVATQLSTDPDLGLHDDEVRKRQTQYGPNSVTPDFR
jgi:Cation transporter/ATPase, N-terminus